MDFSIADFEPSKLYKKGEDSKFQFGYRFAIKERTTEKESACATCPFLGVQLDFRGKTAEVRCTSYYRTFSNRCRIIVV
jgi:hypothetical protein